MKTQEPKKIRPAIGIPIAVITMWAVASLGTFLFIRSHHWLFLGEGPELRAQVLLFHAAYFTSRFPACFIAGIIISQTKVRQPCLTAILIVLISHIPILALWPFTGFAGVSVFVPMAGELAGMLILTGGAALGACCIPTCVQQLNKLGRDNNRLNPISGSSIKLPEKD